jgi:Na+/H+-translocating membrane pyrophosphatase
MTERQAGNALLVFAAVSFVAFLFLSEEYTKAILKGYAIGCGIVTALWWFYR